MFEAFHRPAGVGALRLEADMDVTKIDAAALRDAYVIRGAPETVARKILELQDDIGRFGTLIMCAHDWLDKLRMMRSKELLARKVMPMVNAAMWARA
jgi:limonene 1,2-monooxygenase